MCIRDSVYTICRRNGRHSGLDFPVAGELYADFGVKEDLDVLAEVLPSQIDAIFLCHGIALKADASNALEVQKVNFLGHKYLLEKILPRIADNGSVNIIASTGGFGWQGVFDDCACLLYTSGIALVYCPGMNGRSVAEHAMGLVYALTKQIVRDDREVKAGNYAIRNAFDHMELSGARAGIAGFGQIGRETAKLFRGSGMEVWIYDPFAKPEQAQALGCRYCEMCIRDSPNTVTKKATNLNDNPVASSVRAISATASSER